MGLFKHVGLAPDKGGNIPGRQTMNWEMWDQYQESTAYLLIFNYASTTKIRKD